MFIGPVFTREAAIAPRRWRLFVARVIYPSALLLLMFTAWSVLFGTQVVRDISDLSRFGSMLFQLLAPLQLALAVFFSALVSASAVAQEKDRRTLVLLLLTNLTNAELVLGRLLASMLNVLMLLLTSLPLFTLLLLLGGVSLGQVGRTMAVTLASAVVAGSLGSTLAFWRDKTFQSLAMTALAVVFWLVTWEIVGTGALGDRWWGVPAELVAASLSPWQAILEATRPAIAPAGALGPLRTPVNAYLLATVGLAVALNGLAILRVRVWNPSREIRLPREMTPRERLWTTAGEPATAVPAAEPEAAAVAAPRAPTRPVWNNPIIWREMMTWAYGRRVIAIRVAYLLLFGVAAVALYRMIETSDAITRTGATIVLAPLFVLSLVLVNAQAVTSVTTERDGRALDLLLVTSLTPKEIIYGKLGGILYNTKEMILLPLLLCGYLWWSGTLTLENLVYVAGGLLVLYGFVAMLGVHAGMTYVNSRSAIATSLGTVFFLFVGVATCIRLLIAFSGSFQLQLAQFFVFLLGGGIALFAALGSRNPSPAIATATMLCPLATFYAITDFLLGRTLSVFLVTGATYGFMTAAMLVPAIYEFDVATGRTTGSE